MPMSMRSSWLPALLVGGALLVSLTACSDSSDVGLGVGSGLQGGTPSTLDVTPDVRDTTVAPITGIRRDSAQGRPPAQSQNQSAWRFLVGSVNDPLDGKDEGIVKAEGYVDFAGRDDFPSEITSADPSSLTAELRLTTDYLHGYSSETMDVKVYDLMSEADMDSARATASFNAAPSPVSVDGTQINPSDSLVTIQLKQSWISENIGMLRNTGNDGADFEDTFHGFKIIAPNSDMPDSNPVVGFSSSTAALRLRTVSSSNDTTTADYPSLKTFTHVERTEATDPPSGYRLMQGGVGKGLAIEWAYGEKEFVNEVKNDVLIDSLPADSGRTLPLNRAEIFVPNDTSALETPSGFERPQPQGYRIIATRSSGAPSCPVVRSVTLSDANEACVLPLDPLAAPGKALISDDEARPILDRSFRRVGNGQSPVFTTFRVHIADRESTDINEAATVRPGLPTTLPVLVPVDGTEPGPPRATLTVTPL